MIVSKCPNCGSNDIKRINFNSFKCLSCDYVFEAKRKLTANEIFNKSIKSIFEIYCETDECVYAGTCVVINNYIVTNAHLIKSNNISLKDKIKLNLIKKDDDLDIALLKSNEKFDTLNVSENCFVGEKIYIIGNPKGLGISIVEGIISDCYRRYNNNNVIMFTGDINDGNSGGPLLNDNGEVIGLVVGRQKDAIGMNYAIPSSMILNYINSSE